MKTMEMMAYPQGDLWVIECARCGLVGIASALTVDDAMISHVHAEVQA